MSVPEFAQGETESFSPRREDPFPYTITAMDNGEPWRADPKYGGMSDTAARLSWEAGRQQTSSRIRLIQQIKLSTHRRYLVKGIIPRVGLTLVWGPPKCGKSFWIFDLIMHVTLGWEYRERRVHQGANVYCCFEGQSGFEARKEAFCLEFLQDHVARVPFYLQPVTLELVKDHEALIKIIRATLGEEKPASITLDTLNRSLGGSESSDADMSAYIRAADAIREAFDCAVIIVHHCGLDGTRPRGHTSLIGAVEAQIAVKRDAGNNIIAQVELMKDGPNGEVIVSRLDTITVGKDEDGDDITSCVVRPAESNAAQVEPRRAPKLTPNEKTMLALLQDAAGAILTEQWNALGREAGIGVRRRADLTDAQKGLKRKRIVREYADKWTMNSGS